MNEITNEHTINQHETLELEVSRLNLRVKELEQQVAELTQQNKYVTPEYKYKNEERLNPPVYQPSKDEIALAKARYVMEEKVWDIVYCLEQYIDILEGKEAQYPYTKESITKEAKDSLELWNTALDKNIDIWDALVSPEWFKSAYIDTLSEGHGGDCTALPGSCMRCHAEGMFKIPYTANWSKHEGYRLLQEYNQDYRAKNNIEEATKVNK